jgi:hypothetical protein
MQLLHRAIKNERNGIVRIMSTEIAALGEC